MHLSGIRSSGLPANPAGLSSAGQMCASTYQITSALEKPASPPVTTGLPRTVVGRVWAGSPVSAVFRRESSQSGQGRREGLGGFEVGDSNPAAMERTSPYIFASSGRDGSMGLSYDKNPNYAFRHLLIACARGHGARKHREQRKERLSFQKNGFRLPLRLTGLEADVSSSPAPSPSAQRLRPRGARLAQVPLENGLRRQQRCFPYDAANTQSDLPLRVFPETRSLMKSLKTAGRLPEKARTGPGSNRVFQQDEKLTRTALAEAVGDVRHVTAKASALPGRTEQNETGLECLSPDTLREYL